MGEGESATVKTLEVYKHVMFVVIKQHPGRDEDSPHHRGHPNGCVAVPEVTDYTKISGTPVIFGLYIILIPMTLFALFGSSRQLVVGANSTAAAILAPSIAGMAARGLAEWLASASALAFMSTGCLILARIIRLGFLADFLSRTVLVGFPSSVGVQVALGEISGMLGLVGGRLGPWQSESGG